MCFTKLTKWLDKFIKKMKWYDISLLKASVLFFTLFILTAWADLRNVLLQVEWYWYLILAIIVSVPLVKKLFSK